MTFADRLIKVQHGKSAPTYAALIRPHPALADCIRTYVTRSTVDADLSVEERRNHFPPTPTCAITWFMRGSYADVQLGGKPMGGPLPWPVIFNGPRTQASVSVNPAEVQAFIMLILPDALQALTGLDISTHVNRYSAPADVLDADWQAMLTTVLHAQNDESRVELIESFLLPRWRALGKEPNATAGTFGPWATKVADRAANHAEGRSERQVDRRIKHWTGQPLRQLRGIGRAEDTLFRARDALAEKRLHWADIAADTGYSDQAHLSREMRRIAGLNPKQLQQVMTHESYWLYQIWTSR